MSLEILRSVLAAADPTSAALEGRMPAGELRFVIEFDARPDPGKLRDRLTVILQTDRFVLEPLFAPGIPALERFVLLRVAGVERTLPSDMLFEASYELATALGATSIEPDVGSGFYEESSPPAEGPRAEIADAVRRWCNVEGPPPADHLWALRKVDAPGAWNTSDQQGAGILIAQPDTGVVPTHVELDNALDMDLGFNVLDPGERPVDPLSSRMANPGHGTGTASCVVSRGVGSVTGSAPRARVVPIRCIDDVKVFDASPVARAIDYARKAGCHVITMSLGGVPSRALHEALKAAVDANLIVLAAAGNCVRFVVWPARYNECIAVAGTNVDDVAWKGSCRGGAVDICAPAENVWRAAPSVRDPSSLSAPGQGTSFAVALTAGVAALWLAHHGRDALIAKARAHGISLQRLFRSALIQTARRPDVWDASSFGAGVVDAGALLSLAPDAIRIATKESGAEMASPNELADLVAELDGGVAPQPGFDWARYGLELTNVLMERSRREWRARRGVATEGGLRADRPSASLAKALEGTASPVIESVREARNIRAPVPRAVPASSLVSEDASVAALRVLGSSARKDSRETAALLAPESAREELRATGRDLVDRVLAFLSGSRKKTGPDADAANLVYELIAKHGRGAIVELARSGTVQSLSTAQRVSTEALIKLTGRPALRVRNGDIDYNDPQIGAWQTPLSLIQADIPRIVQSVGRIDLDGAHVGTGFLIADGLVMTNRHVLEAIAVPVPSRVKPKHWILAKQAVTIDFLREQGSRQSLRFKITEVAFAGPTPTNDTEYVDFADLDMALLQVESSDTAGQKLPPPLECLKGELGAHGSQDVLVVGYPARPATLPLDADGKVRRDVIDALMRIFGLRYGVKYLSPGTVTQQPGTLAGDPRQWVFGHDGTTLAGNSGSCVLRYGPRLGVIGLHFSGEFERSNYAHAFQRVIDGKHLPASIEKRFTWVEE